MDSVSPRQRKVLILTYYWPPAGGPGVQRILKFVKYLPQFGWEPIVLTVRNGEYPALDEGLLKEIPPGLKVYSTRSLEFFRFFKWITGRRSGVPIETYILNREKMGWKDLIFTWVRQNVFLPDARVGWVPFAVKMGKEILKKEKPDLIFSSSPPHSLQLAASRLARYSGLPWVADFRDPWTDAFWDKGLRRSTWAADRNQQMEQDILSSASAVTTVSKGFLDLLTKGRTVNSQILPNGYDGADFQSTKQPGEKFRFVYAGHIAASQNPQNFFEALALLPEEIRTMLDIHFFGKFDQIVPATLQKMQLTDLVHLHPYISHTEAVQKIIHADVLLLLIPKVHGKGILTGKVYEYLATGNFILGIGAEDHEASDLLHACNAGEMYGYDADLLPVILSLVDNWKKGTLPQSDRTAAAQFDRKQITARLVGLFNTLCR